MVGNIYNAKKCTVDGSDCWIGYVENGYGRFTFRVDDIQECDSVEEAREFLTRRLRLYGYANPTIEEV